MARERSRGCPALPRQVLVEAVAGQDAPLRDRLGGFLHFEPGFSGAVEDGGGFLDPEVLELSRRGSRCLTGGLRVERLFLPESDDEDAGSLDAPVCVKQQGLVLLSREIAVRHRPADQPADLPVHGAGGPAGLPYPLEQVDDQRLLPALLNFTTRYSNIHFRSSR